MGVPVFLAYGPRCLDLYPYLYRSGLSHSLSVILTADYPIDVPIPSASYSSSQLHNALCLGEFDSFVRLDQRVIRVNLTSDVPESLGDLELLLEPGLTEFLSFCIGRTSDIPQGLLGGLP